MIVLTLEKSVCLWVNKTFNIPLHFRFVLCYPLAFVNKGYRAISGRVEFNPSYRKPQTAVLHLDYSQVRIDTAVDPLQTVKLLKLLNCINFVSNQGNYGTAFEKKNTEAKIFARI